VIEITADFDEPPPDAVIVAGVDDVTGDVCTRNVAELAPAGTTTDAETVAFALLEPSVTVTFAAATPLSVTVPVDVPPPFNVDGDSETPLGTGAFTVNTAEAANDPIAAVIVALAFVDTGTEPTVNVAVVAPAATTSRAVTDATAGLLLVRLTTLPPVAAGPESVTVPVDDARP